MDVYQESVKHFAVGHGGADAVSKPLVTAEYDQKAYKGVRVARQRPTLSLLYIEAPNMVNRRTATPPGW